MLVSPLIPGSGFSKLSRAGGSGQELETGSAPRSPAPGSARNFLLPVCGTADPQSSLRSPGKGAGGFCWCLVSFSQLSGPEGWASLLGPLPRAASEVKTVTGAAQRWSRIWKGC